MSLATQRIIVIGGGAAGFFGAIACARTHPYVQATVLEAGLHCLAKVRISGGGRCNVTHACFDPELLSQHYPRGGRALRGAFSRFQPQDTVAWFAAQGIQLKTEADGRMFPSTNDSSTIVDCLLRVARDVGVTVRKRAAVVAVERQSSERQSSERQSSERQSSEQQSSTGWQGDRDRNSGGFQVRLRSGERLGCDRILLATGSSSQGHRIARSLGHSIVSPVPSLFTFNLNDSRLQGLAGVAVDPVRLRLLTTGKTKLEQIGPLLVTHWGLSGPAVLRLSAWGARDLHNCRYRATLLIDWLPQLKAETVRQILQSQRQEQARRAIATQAPLPLPRRLWQRLIASVGITPETRWSALSNKSLNRLLEELTQGHYEIQGKGVFKEEFVTCGGVALKEVNFKTMASRCCPGLYLAGEILDIDGITGGFNFQSAWTTAWLAGQAMGAKAPQIQ